MDKAGLWPILRDRCMTARLLTKISSSDMISAITYRLDQVSKDLIGKSGKPKGKSGAVPPL